MNIKNNYSGGVADRRKTELAREKRTLASDFIYGALVKFTRYKILERAELFLVGGLASNGVHHSPSLYRAVVLSKIIRIILLVKSKLLL